MPSRVFDEQEIRDIVATLEHPTIVVRGAYLVTVNDAWLEQYGYARKDVEGASVGDFVTSPDQERIRERALLPDDRVSFDKPLRTLAKTGAGALVPVRVYTSRFRAAEGSDYRVAIVLAEPTVGVEPVFALLALSSDIIGAASREDVCARTSSAFERAGLRARFWRDGSAKEARIDEPTARRAIAQHVALFAGSEVAAESVYIPIGSDEILHVEGPELTGQHAFVFGLIGKLVSTALLDVQASQAAQRKLSDTQLLLQLARTTSETLDLDEVMSATADSFVQLLDVASCFILLYDDQTQTLRASASSRARRDAIRDIVIPIDDAVSISAQAARERKVIVIADTTKDARAQRAPFVRRFSETAVAAIPILSRGRLEGVVVVDETSGSRTYTREWVELASAMVAQVGLSITNARLYESLRKSYEEVARTRAEMVKRERLAGLGELAAIVAHEVRNPLGVIYNATNSLKRLTNDSGDAQTLLDIVREECERLNHIVGDLLDFASPRKLTLQPEDIGRILGEVVEAIPESPENVPLRFEVTIEDDLPAVLVDRRLIRQALLNVVLNGTQAMPRGGTLRMRAFCKDSEVLIEIRDEGPGIPDHDLPRIFEPVFTTKATGAGLGLAVVKRIVEDHDGQVRASSGPSGTTFCFRLPVARTT
ncbi:MAG TPA: ATP-binding protein [Polyangiaceae bacterium]|nr:ATP-binding protein [Polyangiaceae bacterium]